MELYTSAYYLQENDEYYINDRWSEGNEGGGGGGWVGVSMGNPQNEMRR